MSEKDCMNCDGRGYVCDRACPACNGTGEFVPDRPCPLCWMDPLLMSASNHEVGGVSCFERQLAQSRKRERKMYSKYRKIVDSMACTLWLCEECGEPRTSRPCQTCRIAELERERDELARRLREARELWNMARTPPTPLSSPEWCDRMYAALDGPVPPCQECENKDRALAERDARIAEVQRDIEDIMARFDGARRVRDLRGIEMYCDSAAERALAALSGDREVLAVVETEAQCLGCDQGDVYRKLAASGHKNLAQFPVRVIVTTRGGDEQHARMAEGGDDGQ